MGFETPKEPLKNNSACGTLHGFLDLVKLEDLFMAPLNPYVDIIIHQASPDRYRQVLERIRNTGITNLIIDTDKDRIDLLLRNVSITLH